MKLQRFIQTSAGTSGCLLSDTNEELCKSLELPWRENAKGISCIPAGHYTAKRRFSPEHHRDVFEIEQVPNRENIEIHHGNTVKDTKGCILVGMRFGKLGGMPAVLDSDVAFEKLMAALQGIDSFPIQIIDVAGQHELLRGRLVFDLHQRP